MKVAGPPVGETKSIDGMTETETNELVVLVCMLDGRMAWSETGSSWC